MEWGASQSWVPVGLVASHVAAAVLAGGLAAYAARHHWQKVSGRLFVALVLSFGVWAVGSMVRLFTLDPSVYVAITAAKYVGVATAPVWFFLFAVVYAGWRHRVTRLRIAALLAVPAATVVAVATTLDHRLFYRSIAPATVQGLTVLETVRGPASWGFIAFGYGLLALGSLVLIYGIHRRPSIYRAQSLLLVIGIAIPWAASVAYIARGMPHPAIDPTPVAFIGGSALLAIGMFTTQLVDLVPAARSRVFEAMADAVLVLDVEGRLVDANSAARALLDADAPIGRPIVDVIPPALGKVAPPVDAQGEVRPLEVDGEVRYYRRRDLPLGDDGEYGSVVVLSDVTDREDARTQLQERQRMLERQNERLEEFASVVSHDLRNPLGIATGNLDLARETGDMDRLEEVARAHDRIEAMIDDLLALARQGRAVGERDTVSIAASARAGWREVANGDATLVVEEGVETVQADRDRLQELFANLFRNAVEHAAPSDPKPEAGGARPSRPAPAEAADGGATVDDPAADGRAAEPSLTVRVGGLADGFYVEDDGPGIPVAKRDQVFEHGYSTAEEGTGFGLSIVKSIAEAHGWAVRVTEGRNGGARFEFHTARAQAGAAELL